LRQVITGSTNDQRTKAASSAADRKTGVPSLPKWAQQPTCAPQNSVTFDQQTLRDDWPTTSPAAIVIVPTGRKNSLGSPPEIPQDGKAASRVELLPSPTEPKNDRSDMIVESNVLAPGFAEWRGDGENAVVRTNSPIGETSTGWTAGDFGWAARSHSNLPASLTSPATDMAKADDNTFADIGSRYEWPAVVTDPEPLPVKNVLPAGLIQKTKPPEAAVANHEQVSDLEPRQFLLSDDLTAPAEESSLETVNWDPESEPGTGKDSSIVGSKAVVGLLIGLACLIGLVVVCRRRAII
jgi:hypothetical protein